MMHTHTKDKMETKLRGCFYGGIVGDALGASYEFKERDSFVVHRDMVPNIWCLPPGSFTDDSSMMLCLADSLYRCQGFDAIDQMETYNRWRKEGYMSSSEERGCFDIGISTGRALCAYEARRALNQEIVQPMGCTGERESGNAGIMRLCPIPLWHITRQKETESTLLQHISMDAAASSSVTHATQKCQEAAIIMSVVIYALIKFSSWNYEKSATTLLEDVLNILDRLSCKLTDPEMMDIAKGCYRQKERSEIKSGGYVTETLEAALWGLYHFSTFEEGMMAVIALGRDTDTVGCVYGQLAGAYFGIDQIPSRWLNALQRPDMIRKVYDNLTTMVP